MNKACYRKLHRYKYQLMIPYLHDLEIHSYAVDTPYLKLDPDGRLEIKPGYAWDGPSGPTIDTLNFMRGSLVHDALYQLIRLKVLPYSYKNQADRILQEICIEDGMSKFRAWYVYQGVKRFGGASATPGSENPDRIICVPIDA